MLFMYPKNTYNVNKYTTTQYYKNEIFTKQL